MSAPSHLQKHPSQVRSTNIQDTEVEAKNIAPSRVVLRCIVMGVVPTTLPHQHAVVAALFLPTMISSSD